MQVILGSGGVIGTGLAKLLPQYTDKVRLVSRNPVAVNQSDELVKADITNYEQAEKAIENADVAYLVLGMQYKIDVWRRDWPKVMTNVINACKKYNTKLVFFDNLYLYGKVDGWMTEDTPANPSSKKGEVRAKIIEQLTDEYKKGNIQALVARAADFNGPTNLTFLYPLVYEKIMKGKKAQWFINAKLKHSLTYTDDAAKATALLGNTPEAYNRTWHLPTDKNAPTGEEFINMVEEVYGKKTGYSILSRPMLKMVGLFVPVIREMIEMLYQYEYEYLFDSTDFENRFFKATPVKQGIEETINSIRLTV
jgi:nucleoside-diphosphate-sugar epimerase